MNRRTGSSGAQRRKHTPPVYPAKMGLDPPIRKGGLPRSVTARAACSVKSSPLLTIRHSKWNRARWRLALAGRWPASASDHKRNTIEKPGEKSARSANSGSSSNIPGIAFKHAGFRRRHSIQSLPSHLHAAWRGLAGYPRQSPELPARPWERDPFRVPAPS